MRAKVIVLAGPSGAGKSRLAERLGLPVLRLDDFYKSGGDPTLPRIAPGHPSRRLVPRLLRDHPSRRLLPRLLRTGNTGLVDWDHPDSWLPHDALAALVELCHEGIAKVPVYDLARDGRCGWQTLDLAGATHFVAEGIFAEDIVAPIRRRGALAAAYCVRQHPLVTFWRRLTRDLREHRKPPLVLLRRGIALMRRQRRVVNRAVAQGCEPVTSEEGYRRIRALLS